MKRITTKELLRIIAEEARQSDSAVFGSGMTQAANLSDDEEDLVAHQ